MNTLNRNLPLLTLIAAALLVGILFYRVIEPFLVALIFAAVLAIIFRPMYSWLETRLKRHRRIAAAIAAGLVLILVVAPVAASLVFAGSELLKAGKDVAAILIDGDESAWTDEIRRAKNSQMAKSLESLWSNLTEKQVSQIKSAVTRTANNVTQEIYGKTQGLLANAFRFVVILVITGLSLYYFFADGDSMLREIRRLSPLEEVDEHALLEQFEKVCRGVILGSVAAALAQGVLAGIAFSVAGVERIWILSVITMMCSFVPFVGAGAVCACVVAGLALDGQYWAAAGLAIYAIAVVTTVDNLIKAHMLHGTAQLHPLIALISVLGALQLIGLWGIFIGPMIAAFFYALLNIVKERVVGVPALKQITT